MAISRSRVVQWTFVPCRTSVTPSLPSSSAHSNGAAACSSVIARLASFLLDDLVGPHQESLRNGDAEGLGGLAVDDQLDLGRQLDRHVRGLGALEHLVGVVRGPPPLF